jgi:hypothetical protein
MRQRFRFLVFILAVTQARQAFAQESTEAHALDADIEKARKLHDEGTALFEEKEYVRACAAFKAAYTLKRNYQTAGSLGHCELQIGQHRDSAEHIKVFIDEYPKAEPPERLEQAKELLAQARAHVAVLRINVSMAGAEVFVDGRSIGKAPIAEEIFVDVGPHHVEAKKGLDVASQSVDVRAGEQRAIVVQMQPKHPVKLHDVQTGNAKMTWAFVAGGVAVVGIGAGFTSLILAHSGDRAKDELLTDLSQQSARPKDVLCGLGTPYQKECARVNMLVNEKNAFQNVAIGAFALGLAGLATSIGLGLSSGNSNTTPKVHTSAFITPTSGGIAVGGQF